MQGLIWSRQQCPCKHDSRPHLAARSFDPTTIHCESALQSRQVMVSWQVPYVRCSCIGDIDFASAGVCHTYTRTRHQLPCIA